MLARKSEGKATAPAAYGTVTDPNPSCGDRGKTASLLTLASVSAAQAAISQGKETPKTASGDHHLPETAEQAPRYTEAEVKCVWRCKSRVAGDAQTPGAAISSSMAQATTVGASTEPPYEPEQPPVTSPTFGELEALIEGGQPNVVTMVNGQNAEGEQSGVPPRPRVQLVRGRCTRRYGAWSSHP
ncbi:hypothetical protein BJV77DRAFT_961944 [Russula vinacea]|nr:hypothetical protein BJV77DRAFT_961944 [Russula vinacea]